MSKFTYTGNWTNGFRQEIPDTANPQSFQQTATPGSFATMNFTGGVAVSIIGATFPGLYHYDIELTDLSSTGNPPAAQQLQGNTTAEVTNATLFYQSGLDPSKNYQLTLQNSMIEGISSLFVAPFAFSYVTVYSIANSTNGTSTSPSGVSSSSTNAPQTGLPSPQSDHKTNIGVIVGPVVAGLALVALLILAFLWRRRRREQNIFLMNNMLHKATDSDNHVVAYTPYTEDIPLTQSYHPYSDIGPSSATLSPPSAAQSSKRELIIRQEGYFSSPTSRQSGTEAATASAPSSQLPPSSSRSNNAPQPVDMDRLEALIEQRVNERIERLAAPLGERDSSVAPPPYPLSNIGHS